MVQRTVAKGSSVHWTQTWWKDLLEKREWPLRSLFPLAESNFPSASRVLSDL